MTTYRTMEVQPKTISPEDEMRLILARAAEPEHKRRLVFGSLALLLSLSAVVYGNREFIFMAVFHLIFVALAARALVRSARITFRT